MNNRSPFHHTDAPVHVVDGAFSAGAGYADNGSDTDVTWADPVTGQRVTVRRRLRRTLQLNLLDHKGVIARKAPAVGASVGTMLQGLLMSGFMGIFLSLMGATSLGMTLLAKAKTALAPVLDVAEQWIEFGKQFGLPLDKFERGLAGDMVAHYLPKRCLKYAVFTLFGRGGGSFWLGAVSAGVTAAYAPDALHQMAGFINSSLLFKHSLEQAADEIISYRFLHHPDVLAERLRQAVFRYKDIQMVLKGKEPSEAEKEQQKQKEKQSLRDAMRDQTFWLDTLTTTARQVSGQGHGHQQTIEQANRQWMQTAGILWQQSAGMRELLAEKAEEAHLADRLKEEAVQQAALPDRETLARTARALAQNAASLQQQASALVPADMRSLFEEFAGNVYAPPAR